MNKVNNNKKLDTKVHHPSLNSKPTSAPLNKISAF